MVLGPLSPSLAHSQTQNQSPGSVGSPVGDQEQPSRLTFDVASIAPTKPGTLNGYIKAQPGGQEYKAQNVPVKLMLSLMYKVPMRQISGGPEWFSHDGYDVEAKADRAYNIDELHIMFQNLLADRFGLKFHKVIKEGPVYALVVDKSGLKMKPNETEQDFNIPVNWSASGAAIGKRVPMQYLCWWLGQMLQNDERPVIDRTGLTKNYDFTLSFMPELPPGAPRENLPPEIQDRPSIFIALRDQLGLRLEAQTGPVEYYVIDQVERPTNN